MSESETTDPWDVPLEIIPAPGEKRRASPRRGVAPEPSPTTDPMVPTDEAVTVAYRVLRSEWDNSLRRGDPPSRGAIREALRQAMMQQAHENESDTDVE